MFGMCRATSGEVHRSLPGDDLVPDPLFSATHAITIRASADQVWPWLAQMGAGRAGWYSYDRLDNGGVPSAKEIIPELQHLAIGDVMPALPGAQDAFIVIEFVPYKNLVLGVPGAGVDEASMDKLPPSDRAYRASWAFALQESDDRHTRLIVRVHLAYFLLRMPGLGLVRFPKPLARLLAGPGHFVMERKQLLGIKQRAEGAADPKEDDP